MSHALIWTELSTSDLNSTVNREIPYAGFGTVTVESWNKRLYKLRWLNSSVDDIKIWLDNEFADIYANSEFASIKSTDSLSIVSDLGFDFRITSLDTFNLFNLPNALAATNLNIPNESVGGVNRLKIPYYVDGVKILEDSKILVKSQTSAAENGFYDIFASTNTVTSGAATSALIYYKAEDIITAGKIVSFGSSSWYAYMEGYTPFQTAASVQPQIVNNGSIITRNSKPYIEATSSRYFQFTTELYNAAGSEYSLWMTYEKDAGGSQAVLLTNGTSYKQLGNAVNIGVVFNVLKAQVLRDLDLLENDDELVNGKS